jgi:PiT family inorganic phosphate transporter
MTLSMIAILGATLFVAYANGANDNFKGVATLFGSGTADYRKALLWATVMTSVGSCAAFFLAEKLIKTFSGKGLVPDAWVTKPEFMASVIFGAGLTVFLAARCGIPISTTHSLTGALAGSGWVAVGSELAYGTLGKSFFMPLILSPFIAMGVTVLVYPLFTLCRRLAGIKKSTCICVGEKIIPVGPAALNSMASVSIQQLRALNIVVDEQSACDARAIEQYGGQFCGIRVQSILDCFHYLSAGALSLARGLNDTPKIVALSVAAGASGLKGNVLGVSLAMALGGLIGARKVAETMSHKITPMSHGQGFTANLVSSFLVILASRWGVPVSTTHVACGSLFGIGMVGGKAHWGIVAGLLSAWFLTLPCAAVISAGCFLALTRIG